MDVLCLLCRDGVQQSDEKLILSRRGPLLWRKGSQAIMALEAELLA
jgi:hypothetical protein